MMALAEAARAPDFPAEIALVLSHDAEAPGLARAAAAGIAPGVVDSRPFRGDRPGHEAAIADALDRAGVELVCLAGWMRVLTPFLVNRYAGRMLNIHPSLLPAFPGLNTHRRALEAGVKLHGCTVHLVTEELDAGPILAQAAVPVLPGDTEARLAARVLQLEHRLYPATLAWFAGGQPAPPPRRGAALCNPLPPSRPVA